MNDGRQQLQNLDARIEQRTQAIREERAWWPCQRGCDHCCRHLAHPPELSRVEWERIDEAVSKLPTPDRMVVEQRIRDLLHRIQENRLDSHVVCPYLDEQDGACRIYDARPLTCRTYGFFVARDHDQYCQRIEQEISDRADDGIVWGNAESIRHDIEQISGAPIAFALHYCDRPHSQNNEAGNDSGQ